MSQTELQKLPLLYLHDDAVTASVTILSNARLRSNPNEYDRFSKKSQSLNLSSELKFLLLITTATSSTHGVISESFVEAAVVVGIWILDRDSRDTVTSRSNELSSRLDRIPAAIMGTNEDSTTDHRHVIEISVAITDSHATAGTHKEMELVTYAILIVDFKMSYFVRGQVG
ncbi:hypothetical protein AB3S75_030832 [Citrus x aurantiifolia]